jgi:hypothetical protein
VIIHLTVSMVACLPAVSRDLIGGEGRLLDPDQAPAGTRRRQWHDEEFAPRMTEMSTLDVAAGAVRRDETVEIVLLVAIGILQLTDERSS